MKNETEVCPILNETTHLTLNITVETSQCDQIWQNFTTFGKFEKVPIRLYLRVYLVFGKHF